LRIYTDSDALTIIVLRLEQHGIHDIDSFDF